MMLQMRRSLHPSRMAGVHFEPASVERKEIVNLVQLMDLDRMLGN
jgi:hypothetical protein